MIKLSEKRISVFDTTLRDGVQGRDMSFSLSDKVKIAKKLDHLGVDYIEAGWVPGNPKDSKFFERMAEENLGRSKIVACGSTRRPNTDPREDNSIKGLIDSGAGAVSVVGKTWLFHVEKVLNTSPEENLEMIHDSIKTLKKSGLEVVYDAEHFFDAYFDDPEYSLKSLKVAEKANVDCITLCDTNGGTVPKTISSIVEDVRKKIDVTLGIHAHNDSGLAVANSLAAVEGGVEVVQGTINGYGERVGNANLCTIIPDLELKMGYRCLSGEEKLKEIKSIANYVSEIANMPPDKKAPYVGRDAFTHKAGLHVDAVLKNPETFEHVNPAKVGNRRNYVVSELSGNSAVEEKMKQMGIELSDNRDKAREILSDLKALEKEGYQFENADASFELLVKNIQGKLPTYFKVMNYHITTEKGRSVGVHSRAEVEILVDGDRRSATEYGNGPVNALDNAFKAALHVFFPMIEDMQLIDYNVRILERHRGSAAKPRVNIEMSDGKNSWNTIGVSSNITEASWEALQDAYIYGLESKKDENDSRQIKSDKKIKSGDELW